MCNLDRYTDVGHYGPDDNRAMVSLMRRGTYIADRAGVEATSARIRSMVGDSSCGAAPVMRK